jgi:hypothetical protein
MAHDIRDLGSHAQQLAYPPGARILLEDDEDPLFSDEMNQIGARLDMESRLRARRENAKERMRAKRARDSVRETYDSNFKAECDTKRAQLAEAVKLKRHRAKDAAIEQQQLGLDVGGVSTAMIEAHLLAGGDVGHIDRTPWPPRRRESLEDTGYPALRARERETAKERMRAKRARDSAREASDPTFKAECDAKRAELAAAVKVKRHRAKDAAMEAEAMSTLVRMGLPCR